MVYKVDPEAHAKANTEIKDMERVLAEIPTTLSILQKLLSEHEVALTTPSLNKYRRDLQNMIPEAVRLAHLIAVNSQRLSSVSPQVVQQLVALDNNVRSALVTKTVQTQPKPQAEGTTDESRTIRVLQGQS